MALNKCPTCKKYTLKKICEACNKETLDAHYTFKKVRDAPKDSSTHFAKKRRKSNATS